ncbi:MAG: radical SAM/SPASM domain protein, ACGX system [Patescibacteria group bacterium]|jgi:radical SAM/SPASM domain protein of ACGX system
MTQPVFSIQWHITTRCQQRCRHCYLFTSPEAQKEISGEKSVTFDKLKLIADNLVFSCQKLGAKPKTSITGGDPILHPYFWELLAYLEKLGIKVSILGNPFKITNKVAEKLTHLGVSKYQMSLDGLPETHDRLRKPGSFDRTIRASKILKKHGIKVGIMTTVSKLNASEIPSLIELVAKEGINSYSFARYCPTHNDLGYMFSPQEYRSFLASVWETYTKNVDRGTKFTLKDHLWLLFLKEEGLFRPEPTNGIIISGCGLGISHLSVLADGTVYACRRFHSPVGQVPEQSFYEIFTGVQMNEFRDYSRLEKCKDCELLCYCRGCMAVAYGFTNHWTAPDPQCWK